MTDLLHTSKLSGRELARARRRAMSRTGAGMAGRGKSRVVASAARRAPVSSHASETVEASARPLTGKALSRMRRALLSTGGKNALASFGTAAGSEEPAATVSDGGSSRQGSRPEEVSGQQKQEACCEACANSLPCEGASMTESQASMTESQKELEERDEKVLDELCETLESRPADLGSVSSGVRAYCRERRSQLARKGKQALPAGKRSVRAPVSSLSGRALAKAKRRERCRVGRPASSACRPSGRVRSARVVSEEKQVETTPRHIEKSAGENALNELCEAVVSSPNSSEHSPNVRAYCRERRNQLSRKGKLALPGKAKKQAIESLVRQGAGSSLTGRAVAKLHRESRCQFGRGDSPGCRPTGRVRSVKAPPKVEVGTTLSGQAVTGTQLEQTEKVTGAEPGTCRVVTGTEYLGVEQFANFCGSVPEPAAAKVGLSKTSHGQLMTGLAAVDSEKVTGDEAGSCKLITGSEYLGAEHFEAVCGSSGINRTQDKVVADRSGKDLRITGVDEARDNGVTGLEAGSGVGITGTDYVNRKVHAEAPAKVQESHTASGATVSVSGGDVSRVDVTGDEQDACRRVTGTEYMSSERFQASCGTRPERLAPQKVGVDLSQGGMDVTGNLVGRSEKVTGNEPGSCQRVTGSQYGESSDAGLCDKRSDKVRQMRTLHGRLLTGTEISHSPKLTGDERGGCLGVTGTEYLGQEHFKQTCSQVPPPAGAEKTGVGYTWNNQPVSGTRVGPSQNVTGDEQGICEPVTGSDYIGRDQVGEFCDPAAVQDSDRRQRHDTSVMPVSGIQPGPDQRIAGNFQRGDCQNITGTPYQGRGSQCTITGESRQPRRMHHLVRAPGEQRALTESSQQGAIEAEPYQGSFSVMSPARAVWQERDRQPVHSSVYGVGGSITGVVNKAEGVISGTPEFRHPHELNAAPVVAAEPAAEDVQRERITGEGREAGTKITGDDWSRSNFVTGTEGMFSAKRNQTMRGAPVERNNIGAHALKDRERVQATVSRVTGGSGNVSSSSMVTLSGGASG